MYIKKSEPQVPVGYSVGREVLAWAQCKNWGGIVVVLTGSWGCSCFIHGDHCLHPLTQASYGSAPVKEKQYSFILLPTILSQTSVLRLRPCWLWTAADNEHLVRVLLYLQVTGALLLIIKPFLVIIIFPSPPILWWTSIAVISCNHIYHTNCILTRKNLDLQELFTTEQFWNITSFSNEYRL